MSFQVKCAALAASIVLTACGGGGSGGDSSSALSSESLLSISSVNQAVVTQETMSAQAGAKNNLSGLTGAEVQVPSSATEVALAQLLFMETFDRNTIVNTLVGATVSKTAACKFGGTETVSGTFVEGQPTLYKGNKFTLTAQNCQLVAGEISSGTVAIAVNEYVGNPTIFPRNVSFTVGFQDFVTQKPVSAERMNGDLTIELNGQDSLHDRATFKSSYLSYGQTLAGVTVTRILKNMLLEGVVSPNVPASVSKTSTTLVGTLTTSVLGSKTITYRMVQPFVTLSGNTNPSSGQMLIFGANNSSLRITAISAANYTSELDADGDGNYEPAVTRPWSALSLAF